MFNIILLIGIANAMPPDICLAKITDIYFLRIKTYRTVNRKCTYISVVELFHKRYRLFHKEK